MSITEGARNHLFNKLRETLGAEEAATMMELLPPVGWADVARRSDLDHLESRLNMRFDSFEQRFATKDELREQTNRFIGWTLTMNATMVAVVGLIVTLR